MAYAHGLPRKPRVGNGWRDLLMMLAAEAAISTGSWMATHAQEATADLAPAAESFLAPYVSSGSFNGAVLVLSDGTTIFERGYGDAEHEPAVPVEPQTRFRIASVTKTFTAAAIVLLAERGLLDLDGLVGDYVAEFPHGDRIKVSHLLDHESGLPNYYYDLEDFPTLSKLHYESPADVVRLVSELELRFDPGTRRSYNNVNYSALAWLIEEVAGIPYGEFLRSEVLGPLGLEATGYSNAVAEVVPNLAEGYEPVGASGFEKSRYFDHSIFVGAGSMYSTARDLATWANSLIGGALLQGEWLQAALGFGWSEQDLFGRRAYVASGWDNVGNSSHLIHLPAENLTVVALCNLNIAQVVGEIAEGLAALALSEQPQRTEFAARALPDDMLQPLAGRYRFGDDFYSPGGVLDLVVRDGWLVDVGREPDAVLIPLADGAFLYRPVWARVQFTEDEHGAVTGLTFYDRFSASKEDSAR